MPKTTVELSINPSDIEKHLETLLANSSKNAKEAAADSIRLIVEVLKHKEHRLQDLEVKLNTFRKVCDRSPEEWNELEEELEKARLENTHYKKVIGMLQSLAKPLELV